LDIQNFEPKTNIEKKIANCARVYVGTYIGGGTNEFERQITCNYSVEGRYFAKELKPIRVQWSTSEVHTSLLRTFVIYPKTETAIIYINNSHGKRRLKLVKAQRGQKSTIFKVSV
jgi:hypothetical protein